MNILLVEDRGSVAQYMAEKLSDMGHHVFDTVGINDAQSNWDHGNIDCIVLDLNMSPLGLKENEIKQTAMGVLTGWIWLKEYVLNKEPLMSERIIIYSEYINNLKEAVSSNELRGLYLIPKQSSKSMAEKIINCINIISQLPSRGTK